MPGCGSLGPPVWSCQRPWSFCVTRPSSPSGSPLRSWVGAGVGVAGRVGSLGARDGVEELVEGRRPLAADGGDAERRERHDVGVELADPVDQAVAAGVADQDVQPGAAVRPVLVGRVRVRGVVVARLDLARLAGAVGAGRRRRDDVVGLQQVVAPAAPQRVVAGAADQPVVLEVAEDDVVAVGERGRELQAGGAVGRQQHAAVDPLATGLVARSVEEPVVAGGRLRRGAVGVERDGATRVELVVERELAATARLLRVPRVGVVTVRQGVARVPGVLPVALVDADQGARGAVPLGDGADSGLAAGHRVVAGAAVQEVVAPAAEDDVVGVVRLEQRVVATGRVRLEVVRREVDSLVQRVGDVDRRRLDLAGRVDELVEHVAVAVAGVGVGRQQAGHAVERLAHGRVAAGEDPAVVAEDAVLAGAAGDPVVAPAGDDVVVAGVAEHGVVGRTGVDGVVAGLAVHLVGPAEVGARADDQARSRVEEVRPEVGAARRVVEQGHAADDQLLAGVRVVVEERHVLGDRADVGAVDSDDPDDPAVVADDRVGVVAVHQVVVAAGVGAVVAGRVGAGAAEEDVGAVRPVAALGQAEEVAAATEDVVLADAAEHDVVAAAALDVVLAVGERLERRDRRQRADRVAQGRHQRVAAAGRPGGADVRGRGEGELDAAVALDDVVAQLAEDLVVGPATRDVVVAEAAGTGRAGVEGGGVQGGVVDRVRRPTTGRCCRCRGRCARPAGR